MEIYQKNIRKFETKTLKLNKLLNKLSALRLLIFITSSIAIIILIRYNFFVPALVVFFLTVFIFAFVITRYNKIAFQKKHAIFLKEINESEILREQCSLESFDTGEQFVNEHHPYSSDLDIFGQHSLFQLLNRTTSESGTLLLADWLCKLEPEQEILERQNATKDLSLKLEWRQDFQATGMHFLNKKSDYNKLLTWAEALLVPLNQRIKYSVFAIILSMLSLTALFYSSTYILAGNGLISLLPIIVILFINNKVLKTVRPIADNIVEIAHNDLMTLRSYQALIDLIEREDFTSKRLQQLKSTLTVKTHSAALEIKKLLSILEFSHQKNIRKIPISGNVFYSIFNILFLLDFHLVVATEKWKSRNGSSLHSWAMVVSEFEVLNSFAGFGYSNPSFAFPEIMDSPYGIHFESLGHPLLSSAKRINNDFHIKQRGEVVMVTGSNMAGKSTFLRTAGINLVLAQIGAPCCTKYGRISNLKVFTSMRTQDNLKEGVSSFYAELRRIEKLLKLIESDEEVFFLLDEMFKGTNSEDRYKGGFSLISQIKQLNTSGIIATHDVELAKLSENKMSVSNYSFNSKIENGSMIFNYELQPGICNDFNASELMKKCGIHIIESFK